MKSLVAVPIVFAAALACSGVGEKTDTTKILPVEDFRARDTTPPPPPPRLARLTLMDSFPNGGICSVRRYSRNADQAREIFYETVSPPRTFVVEIGKPPRVFLPVSLDIRGTQMSGGLTETENVFVGFTGDGRVNVGTRRYSSTGTAEVNDREPLKTADTATALMFVRRILDMCDR
jgi:hypothetical protein